ncbi:MAG: ribokinase [Mycobacterium sp.]
MGDVFVVGSINMDVVAQAPRFPKPGETLFGTALSITPGGKGANQAVAARRSGATVRIYGALGKDSFGDTLIAFLAREGIDASDVSRVQGSSGTAIIVVDASGENSIVAIPAANNMVGPSFLRDIKLSPTDVVLLQNEIPEQTNRAAVSASIDSGATTILNMAPFKKSDDTYVDKATYIVLNETEFAQLIAEPVLAMTPGRVAGLLAEGAGPATNLVVTLGAEGLQARINGSVLAFSGHKVEPIDSTGAGDCFCGAFGAALASGRSPKDALAWANGAAALSVATLGAGPSMPTAAQVEAFLRS